MTLQEKHHVLDGFLGLPGRLNHLDPFLGDAGDFNEALDLVLDDVEGFQTEVSHDAFGGDGADAFNQAAAQVLLKACEGGGFGLAVGLDLELLTELGMLFPEARHL